MNDTDAVIQKLLSRIAALEGRPAQPAGLDPRALTADPVGTLTRAGVPVEHVLQVLLANHLGDQAPPQLRALAAQGPLVSQTQSLSADVQAVRQRLDQLDAREKQAVLRQSFSGLTADKQKYPLLAAAFAKNPGVFDTDLASHQGDAAALADSIEARLKAIVSVVAPSPTASSENAGTAQVQSTQDKQAQSQAAVGTTGIDNTPPPMPQSTQKQGVFTPTDHEALKAKVLAKAQSGGYARARLVQ